VLEVQSIGGKTSTTRTPEQTQIARFWADQAGTATPPGHWNSIATAIAHREGLTLRESTGLLATLNVALGDSGIATWKMKYDVDLWRPVTAIQLADQDDRPGTVPDPLWESLIITPPFPEYPSGHSTFSGAAATVLTQWFGEGFAFSAESDNLPLQFGIPNVTRSFPSFEAAAKEASMSRVYGGIHYRFGSEDGLTMGNAIGQWTLSVPLPTLLAADTWSVY
jgi:hypothetical protein